MTVSVVFTPVFNLAGLCRNRIQHSAIRLLKQKHNNSPRITAQYKRSCGINKSPWRKEGPLFFSPPWLKSPFHVGVGREAMNSVGAVTEADCGLESLSTVILPSSCARARAARTCLPRVASGGFDTSNISRRQFRHSMMFIDIDVIVLFWGYFVPGQCAILIILLIATLWAMLNLFLH